MDIKASKAFSYQYSELESILSSFAIVFSRFLSSIYSVDSFEGSLSVLTAAIGLLESFSFEPTLKNSI